MHRASAAGGDVQPLVCLRAVGVRDDLRRPLRVELVFPPRDAVDAGGRVGIAAGVIEHRQGAGGGLPQDVFRLAVRVVVVDGAVKRGEAADPVVAGVVPRVQQHQILGEAPLPDIRLDDGGRAAGHADRFDQILFLVGSWAARVRVVIVGVNPHGEIRSGVGRVGIHDPAPADGVKLPAGGRLGLADRRLGAGAEPGQRVLDARLGHVKRRRRFCPHGA